MSQQLFTSWARQLPVYEYAERPAPERSPPFTIAPAMNARIVLTERHAVDLEVEAVVVGNNEALSDRSGETGEVFERGGPLLSREASTHAGTRTGESRITGGHNLRARHAVHSIGPRYQAKYAAAAESALHWCYRSALQLCREHRCRTVALCALHTPRKGYPTDDGAHVALRTLRRFLEQDAAGSFDAILLALPGEADREAYGRIAPLYFPRNPAELSASNAHLPTELGDEHGEITVRERHVRVLLTPGSESDVPVPIALDEDADSFRSFSSVQPSPDERPCRRSSDASSAPSSRRTSHASHGDAISRRDSAETAAADTRRQSYAGAEPGARAVSREGWGEVREGEPPIVKMVQALGDGIKRVVGGPGEEEEEEAHRFYRRLVQRANAEEASLAELTKRSLLYPSGVDVLSRPAVVVIGERIHACCATPAMRDQVMLLLIKQCAALAAAPFVVVFVATGMPNDAGPTFDFLRTLLSALPMSVHHHLRRFYLVHPTLKLRFTFTLLGAVLWGQGQFRRVTLRAARALCARPALVAGQRRQLRRAAVCAQG